MSQVLRQLPKPNDPNLLVGPEHHSDAGVYRVAPDLAVVQTVDFFPPLTDDPYVYGQIAAANSLSDVYAMGAQPKTALNIVGFPDDELSLNILNEILRGGAEKVIQAGAVTVGGHSVRDAEIKYGLSVTGVIHPDKIISNAGAKPGDVLVLTKQIGTGAMTAAYQKDAVDEAVWNNACARMAELNDKASQAMIEAGALGATDITGFGLLGHGSEMAEASGVTLEFQAESVPLLDGARDLSKRGFITRAVATNGAYLDDKLALDTEISPYRFNLLIDAQTSGGLLIALPESKLDAFAAAFVRLGGDENLARPIGRVVEQGSALIRITE